MKPIAVPSYTGGQTVVHILEEIRAEEEKAAMLCGEEFPSTTLTPTDPAHPHCERYAKIWREGQTDA